jgi:sporulation protein YlmC with PRC-barrel domain
LLPNVEGGVMKARALTGMPVLSINDGLRLGTVEELLVDPVQRRIAALAIGQAGQTRLVPFDQVKSIGEDAVTVENTQVAQEASAQEPLAQLPTLSSLLKLSVVDVGGTRRGALTELEVDPADGHVTEAMVHQGGILGVGGSTLTVPVSAIRSLGPQLVMIEVPPAPEAQ